MVCGSDAMGIPLSALQNDPLHEKPICQNVDRIGILLAAC